MQPLHPAALARLGPNARLGLTTLLALGNGGSEIDSNQDDPQAVELQGRLAEKGFVETLAYYSQLNSDSDCVEQAHNAYLKLQK